MWNNVVHRKLFYIGELCRPSTHYTTRVDRYVPAIVLILCGISVISYVLFVQPSVKEVRTDSKRHGQTMPSQSHKIKKFSNCRILRNHSIIRDDLWVRNGKILNPEKVFFEENLMADEEIDCHNAILAPGFIDIQINGAFGVDFSEKGRDIQSRVDKVAKGLLQHGVTSFCPTIITSPSDVYKEIIPQFKRSDGSVNGAGVLGLHIEGPFINKEKKGAHPPKYIVPYDGGFQDLINMYGSLDNVSILTLAPETSPMSCDVITELVRRNIAVSLGHSMANLKQGESAVQCGANLITHLFNAMLPFHHRDPHLVGLLASDNIPKGRTVYFGIISDGIHTDESALRIAYRAHPKGVVLVTDAVTPMGLGEGVHVFGQLKIEITKDHRAVVYGTDTLCGSIATLNECVKIFKSAARCSAEEALESASLHPALALGITDKKGTLNYGTDADFVVLDDNLDVQGTFIAGNLVWKRDGSQYVL